MNTVAYEREPGSDTALAGTLVADARTNPARTVTSGATLGSTLTVPDEAKRAAEKPSHTTTVLPRVEAGDDGTLRLSYAARRRYEATEVLGEGGMGTVALALDHDIDRKVAIKQIRPEVGGAGIARFAEEVRTIGRLEHPNIIPIHDVGVNESGQYFFVMKYVEGETLEDVIERLAEGDPEAHEKYTFEVRAQIMIGLLRALAYAHDRGIVHRDVKPANIMVGPYGEVVLMDWGIARPVEGHDVAATLPGDSEIPSESEPSRSTRRRLVQTSHAQVVGTPAYMSPEQARGASDVDARSDLYSASVVFHELLTLEHYLDDKQTLAAMIAAVISQEPPPIRGGYRQGRFGAVPSELAHYVFRGMQKDRDKRWQSASEMIAELEDALEGKVRVQCHATMTKRMARESGRFVDRHPHAAFFGLIGIGVSSLAGVAAGVTALIYALT